VIESIGSDTEEFLVLKILKKEFDGLLVLCEVVASEGNCAQKEKNCGFK